jgi:predicted ATPase
VALKRFSVAGYRSLRDIELPLDQVNVITGPNGSGKSNLYQALALLAKASHGEFALAMAQEGGLGSAFWAGGERIRYTRKREPPRIQIGVETIEFHFSLSVGWRAKSTLPEAGSLFSGDPEVKEEELRWNAGSRPVTMLKRRMSSADVRNSSGDMDTYPFLLRLQESVLPQISEPHRYPELAAARHQIQSWRFYHEFRTDARSPLRQPQIGVQTDVLSSDGRDVAAALQTIREIGDNAFLDKSIADALGGQFSVSQSAAGFSIALQVPGIKRPLEARELSDGQLKYLCLAAALLSPRIPPLIALNEPEESLHPDLYDPLAALIARASKNSQVWVTTHSRLLAEKIAKHTSVKALELKIEEGETRLAYDLNSPRRPHKVIRFD